MLSRLIAPLSLIAALVVALASCQQCSMVTESDLGNTTTPSTNGLISDAFTVSGDNVPNPLVQLLAYHIVCQVVAPTRGMYRYFSVIANYTANGEFGSSQFDFGCNQQGEWSSVVAGSTDFAITTPPDGDFETTPRIDCGLCISPQQFSRSVLDTHCVRKLPTVTLCPLFIFGKRDKGDHQSHLKTGTQR